MTILGSRARDVGCSCPACLQRGIPWAKTACLTRLLRVFLPRLLTLPPPSNRGAEFHSRAAAVLLRQKSAASSLWGGRKGGHPGVPGRPLRPAGRTDYSHRAPSRAGRSRMRPPTMRRSPRPRSPWEAAAPAHMASADGDLSDLEGRTDGRGINVCRPPQRSLHPSQPARSEIVQRLPASAVLTPPAGLHMPLMLRFTGGA